MTRTFMTSADQDAAIAWKAKAKGVSEDTLIQLSMVEPLDRVVREWTESQGSAVFDAFQKASLADRDAVLKRLGL